MNQDLLDPKARVMLEEMKAADRPNANEVAVEEARANLERLFADLGKGPEVQRVVDRTIPGPAGDLPIRTFYGMGAGPERPLIVFAHGGGFVQGSLNTHDSLCRGLANACRATVMSVGYRLAPEATFPAAYDDVLAATEWAIEDVAEASAAAPVVLAGDSAGGALAAAISATIERPERLAAQILIYPLVSFARKRELYDQGFEGFFLTLAEVDYFHDLYVPPGIDLFDPRLSPLESEGLAQSPPTILVAGQCDPLHLQAEAMHAGLTAAGVVSKQFTYPGMIHGFYGMTGLFEQAQVAFDDVGRELDAMISGAENAAG